jgi:hypothetical protein
VCDGAGRLDEDLAERQELVEAAIERAQVGEAEG